MKYIKKFESIEDRLRPETGPQIGDYVICADVGSDAQRNFTSNNIGKIIDITQSSFPYNIYYENAPVNLFPRNNNRVMGRGEIIYFSPNIEDCETYLSAKKYNL